MLAAAHLTRRFGDRVAVDDLSLDVNPGEIVALLGPNGAGKTTTLRMLAALIAPSAGTVRINGDLVDRDNAARLRGRVGFLTEAPGLWDRLTVRENLLVYARLHGLHPPAAAVDAALDTFDIRDRANDPTARLSKGLKQRVALARTLLHDPDIILLDEPTSGLDPESAREVRDLVQRLKHRRRAILLSTHNLDEVDRVATRVAVLKTRLVAADTPAALRQTLFGDHVRIVVNGPAERYAGAVRLAGASRVNVDGSALVIDVSGSSPAVPVLVRAVVGAGADVESVTRETPTLEQVYLRLMDGRH